MNTKYTDLTLDELDQLCQLYMDAQLSVLEEKELESVVLHSSLTSPAIEDVRRILPAQLANRPNPDLKIKKKRYGFIISRVAAAIGVVLISTLCYFSLTTDMVNSNDSDAVYIAAYIHGKQLDKEQAAEATNRAMLKADSLMRYAAMVEQDYKKRAEEIIATTKRKPTSENSQL